MYSLENKSEESRAFQSNLEKQSPTAQFKDNRAQSPIGTRGNTVQREKRANLTGMPDDLKSGIESLSGFSMDDVRVHYNSSKPATVQALAYTQGTDIHVAPGQEKHLPHEAWHVAQQMAGRVSPTTNINGMPVNDNAELEHEADVMGAKAVQGKTNIGIIKSNIRLNSESIQRMPNANMTCFKDYVITDEQKNHRGLLLNGTEIHLKDEKTPKVENKIEALKVISEKAAELGNATRDSMAPLERFYVVISANYKTRRGKNNVKLYLTFDFRAGAAPMGVAGGPGYIVRVVKNSTHGTGNSATKHHRHASMISGPLLIGHRNAYSNSHDVIDGSSILSQTYIRDGRKGDFRGKTPDAYTKLVAEGARFRCVRDNVDKIKNETVFWVQRGKRGYGITFHDLWQTWSATFNRKYDILNQEIIKNLMDGHGQLVKTNGSSTKKIDKRPKSDVIDL